MLFLTQWTNYFPTAYLILPTLIGSLIPQPQIRTKFEEKAERAAGRRDPGATIYSQRRGESQAFNRGIINSGSSEDLR